MAVFLLYLAIAVSVLFAFWNGFTDAANAISTVVATRVLKPGQAVALSAVGNFIGMFFGTAVAVTIGKGIVASDVMSGKLILAALIGGLVWDYLTYRMALPCSESHVLIGGLLGAGFAAGGLGAIHPGVVVDKVLIPMAVSPFLAAAAAFLFAAGVAWAFRRMHRSITNTVFGKLQILSSLFFSVTHGTNDAQKTMGIITAVLLSYGAISAFEVPLWVIFLAHAAISLGTLFGGWRIVRTMGMRITKLRPYHGFCAETSSALILALTAFLGFPVSTTHAISGSIIGVGITRRFSAVRWGITRRIAGAWILTIPASSLFAFLTYHALSLAV